MKNLIIVLLLIVSTTFADLYLQSPRGCNDRLNEANTDRDNDNRLFDSQNNAKGGYCLGPSMTYYSGSRLSIEWTNQHGCGNPKVECNLVIQYMCGSSGDSPSIRIRDGTTTTTIPNDAGQYNAEDANGFYLYGMHESYQYYQQCTTRDRNMGLFIADREEQGGLNQGRLAAIFTRQNNNGDQHGFECPEERDYYPYWHDSPWIDVAIITTTASYCSFYRSESQNVKGRNYCATSTGTYLEWNNEKQCTSNSGVWQSVGSHSVSAPDCIVDPWTRDNHLGNTVGAYTPSYNWTLPTGLSCISGDTCQCVLRLRYNISTAELKNNPSGSFTDWTYNGASSPVQQDDIISQDGNYFKLALNTDQFGRTFQDRSFVFHIKSRPSGVSSTSRIYNLNVRGKRGNIVQTYPATEYDFVPERLLVYVNDYVHFQWTGCDTNPAGNAGEGTDQTDRSNIVQIEGIGLNYPANDTWVRSHTPLFESVSLRQRMAYLGQTNCPTNAQLLANNGGNQGNADADPSNCFKLNAAPAYFDGGLVRMNKTGTFFYMSTRNNNFTNRSQKAVLIVNNVLPPWAIALVVVGAVLFVGALGVAGGMFYAKSHPHSRVAAILNKF